jgi:Rrf2 family transcriptional regulator, nitric oxide-sensitive transcriptional repressor
MKLTRHTDYALRVLMHLAAKPGQVCSIVSIAQAHGISENHLMKVVHNLSRKGLLDTARGRGGGIRLARPANTISVGEVVRATEQDCPLVDCAHCILASSGCRLNGALAQAQRAFFAVLDGQTIAQVAQPAPSRLAS